MSNGRIEDDLESSDEWTKESAISYIEGILEQWTGENDLEESRGSLSQWLNDHIKE